MAAAMREACEAAAERFEAEAEAARWVQLMRTAPEPRVHWDKAPWHP